MDFLGWSFCEFTLKNPTVEKMKNNGRFSSLCRNISSERATVFLEYTMLFAFVAVVAFAPLLPNGPAYEFLRQELLLRVFLITMPMF